MKERSGPAAANIAIRASFLPLCLFAASSQKKKTGWNLQKKKTSFTKEREIERKVFQEFTPSGNSPALP